MARRLFKTILIAIQDPHQHRQVGLTKAARLAERLGARLTLFHTSFNPYAVGPNFYRTTLEKGVKKTLSDRRAALEKLAAPLRRRGLKVTVRAQWDYPVQEGIVREVLRTKPDLVVAESHRHAFGARLFLANTDWQLIRLCPAPLLFVKNPKPWGKARVVAAIDPLHTHDKPAHLDRRILEAAQALAGAHGGQLDVVHAYLPLSTFMMGGAFGQPLVTPLDPKIERQQQAHMLRALQRLVTPLGLPREQLHVQMGSAEAVIAGLAKQRRADVVVMGAVSRRGLDRLFIGSTAERAIDRLPCDVLVMKPARFKTTVPKRTRPEQLILPPV